MTAPGTDATIRNLIMIRYNMAPPENWHNAVPRNLDPAWLERRRELFERFCLPSLLDQVGADMTALIYFDARTPEKVISEICRHSFMRRVLTAPDAISDETMLAEAARGVEDLLREWAGSGRLKLGDIIATTRLDSDDAISPRYLALMNEGYREAGRSEELYAYFPQGQQFVEATGDYLQFHFPKNAFGTLFEPWQDGRIRTVMHCSHGKLLGSHRSAEIAPGEMHWCMVIHDNNVWNRAEGKPVTTYFPVGEHRA